MKPYLGHTSPTEFEVLAGALGWGPQSVLYPKFCFAYQRDPAYIETLDLDLQRLHHEPEDSSRRKVAAIKAAMRSRASGDQGPGIKLPQFVCCRRYDTPLDLAVMFFADVLACVQKHSPWNRRVPTPLMAEFVQHVNFAWSLDVAYVGQISVQGTISKYARGEGTRGAPLIVVGDRACGKSAAVAHWMLNNSQSGFVLPHFVGCYKSSNDHVWIMRRILLEVQTAFGLKGSVPLDSQALQDLLPLWLTRACRATEDMVTIIIDGVDQLADAAARTLRWLPERIPDNCSLILTTTNADLRVFRLRGWNELVTMPPLQDTYKGVFTRQYMKHAAKNIDAAVVEILERAPATSNPLYLRLCLDELMVRANFATVKSVAKELVACRTLSNLCQLILQRYESVFGKRLVESVLRMLVSSRYGLTEEEVLLLLRDMPSAPEMRSQKSFLLSSAAAAALVAASPPAAGSGAKAQAAEAARAEAAKVKGEFSPSFKKRRGSQSFTNKRDRVGGGGDLPWLSWAPFYKSALGLLANNGGLVGLSCCSFQQAARERYLSNESTAEAVHRQLAAFFTSADPSCVDHSRRCDELPYELLHAKAYDALGSFLLDIGNFAQLWTTRRYDIYMYWRRIGGGITPHDVAERYSAAVAEQAGPSWWEISMTDLIDKAARERLSTLAERCGYVAEFLSSLSYFSEAAEMQRQALYATQKLHHKNNRKVARALCQLANTENQNGQHQPALTKLEQAIGLHVIHADTNTPFPPARVWLPRAPPHPPIPTPPPRQSPAHCASPSLHLASVRSWPSRMRRRPRPPARPPPPPLPPRPRPQTRRWRRAKCTTMTRPNCPRFTCNPRWCTTCSTARAKQCSSASAPWLSVRRRWAKHTCRWVDGPRRSLGPAISPPAQRAHRHAAGA